MSVVAKFYVTKVEPPEADPAKVSSRQVMLSAVCRGIENAMWAQATPSGSISMNVKNDAATDQFEMGAEYEVTFRRVQKPLPHDGHTVEPTTNQHGYLVCRTCGLYVGHGGAPQTDVDNGKVQQHEDQYGLLEPSENSE